MKIHKRSRVVCHALRAAGVKPALTLIEFTGKQGGKWLEQPVFNKEKLE